MSENPHYPRRQPEPSPSEADGLDAALTIVGDRIRYWRERRAKINSRNPAGQIETELLLVEQSLQARRQG